ncbi:MAG: 5'-methylthioadenosine/adenosylhomocysteine nucleosidase [Spirochaetaceae bacterium]|jgi:adenosylhomocysteine nucleosidase|nr:5'-methylthioadenosine/adenosylhomocysteine nucleosidase [Spirochaetaceae bacterium]
MIGIIGAMEEEVALFKKEMQETSSLGEKKIAGKNAQGFTYYTGKIAGEDVVLLQCGIGKVNAAVGAALMIELYQPSLVINTGSAGGMKSGEQKIGDVVIGNALVQYDVDVTAFDYKPGQVPRLPQFLESGPEIVGRAKAAAESLGIRCSVGLIGSGDAFMHKDAEIAALRKTFPDIAACEMEGAAIAQACYVLDTPFLVIRALSDIAGATSAEDNNNFVGLAAKHTTEIVKKLIRK